MQKSVQLFSILLIFHVFLCVEAFGKKAWADSGNDGIKPSLIESLGRDLASPVRRSGSPFLIGGALATVATYPLKSTHFQSNIAANKPLGEASQVGYELGFWRINAAYIAVFGGYGWITGDSKAIQQCLLMIRATTYTGLVTTGIKALSLEERPRGGGDFYSFPSGHSSNIFAFAGVVARNHGWVYGVPAFLAAGFVGFSRMNDNAHYLHDVLFGAGLGMSYAFGLDAQWGKPDEPLTVTLVPQMSSDHFGVGALVQF